MAQGRCDFIGQTARNCRCDRQPRHPFNQPRIAIGGGSGTKLRRTNICRRMRSQPPILIGATGMQWLLPV